MPLGMVMGKHLPIETVRLAVPDGTMVAASNRYYMGIGAAIGGGRLVKSEVDFYFHQSPKKIKGEFIASKEDLVSRQVTFVFAAELSGNDAHHFHYLFVAMSHCLKDDIWKIDDVVLSGELKKNTRAQMRELWFKQAIECL